jgi:periplasmic copper chaperone A
MSRLKSAALAALLILSPHAAPLLAEEAPALLGEANGIRIEDGYAFAAGAMARSGAGYMRITNSNAADDRLVAVRSDAAQRVELHTHVLQDGVARMVKLEEGIALPAGTTVVLERGGLHVMFMGLTGSWTEAQPVEAVLVFETAGEIPVALPVAAEVPMPPAGTHGGHGAAQGG